jgi:hypothetical protein
MGPIPFGVFVCVNLLNKSIASKKQNKTGIEPLA